LQAYTVEQVAKMLHIGRDKVYQLLRTGQLRSIKIGKLRRITEEQLARQPPTGTETTDAMIAGCRERSPNRSQRKPFVDPDGA
jgi:excisionase family DNA binding protein